MRVDADLLRCRDDFPALARVHDGRPLAFLDGPAGTQVPRAVIDAVSAYYATCNANSHGAFPTSRESDALVEDAREVVAAFLGASSGRCISFGANMTTLAFSLSHAFGRLFRSGDRIVVTQLDHEANRGPWLALQERGLEVEEVRLRPDGRLDEDDLVHKVRPGTRLLALGLASNALGTVNDAVLARRICDGVGALLLLDAVHYAAHLSLDVEELQPDLLLCSAYKFYGPHVGVLYARPGLLEQLPTDRLAVQDAAAPFRAETGTLNHAALAGVKAAIEYIGSWGRGDDLRGRVVSGMERIASHERDLALRYDAGLARLPRARRWGPDFHGRRAPTVSITIEGMPAGDAAYQLGRRGIQVWDGHFYAQRVVEVLGLAERGGLLRVGFNMYNTADEVDRLLAALGELTSA